MRAWLGPKADNIMLRWSRALDVVGSGCDNLVSEPILGRKCADEDVGPLRGGGFLDPKSPRGVDLVSLICIFLSLPSMRLFGSSLPSSSIETLKLSEFGREQAQVGDPLRSSHVSS
ncbi:hypothetical protein TB1_012932 [Malus domestica]